ncbi:MAG TPA: hypothetical protein VI955_01200 [Candidatus Omnitrophota bacterium]|nr:hypothetical protein [Candidatus Omnitrophota bacterium]
MLRLRSAQTALEYLLLFGIVAAAVLAAFRYLLPQVRDSSEGYYNNVTRVIMGEKPGPIDGGWCDYSACPPGVSQKFRTCQCPAPAFGGADCAGPGQSGC